VVELERINIRELNNLINEKKSEVDRHIIRNRNSEKNIRTRVRDRDEQKILDKLCIKRWKKAEQEGKIKYLTKRKWFYDFD